MPPVVATPLESKAAQPSQPALVAQKSERITAAKPIVAPVADEGTEKQVLNKSLASITTPEARAVKPPVAHERTKRGATAQGPARMSKETTPEQQAENAYSKAVSLIESGQRQEAITALESLLGQTPRHASARQTLVGLLLDAKRPADATRVLQEGLKLDPARTGMAMVLARIQVEKGDIKAALVSLQQSLPYAAKAPDYYAFMAALFQREKRHQEAIEHYRVALGMVPGNGLWLMGYGISLQAENRLPEARTAFIQARDSGKLAPDLRAFVEQRISQLR